MPVLSRADAALKSWLCAETLPRQGRRGGRAPFVRPPSRRLISEPRRQRNGCRGKTDDKQDERRNDGPLQGEAALIPNGTYHSSELSSRRIRYRMFSQPGGLLASYEENTQIQKQQAG